MVEKFAIRWIVLSDLRTTGPRRIKITVMPLQLSLMLKYKYRFSHLFNHVRQDAIVYVVSSSHAVKISADNLLSSLLSRCLRTACSQLLTLKSAQVVINL